MRRRGWDNEEYWEAHLCDGDVPCVGQPAPDRYGWLGRYAPLIQKTIRDCCAHQRWAQQSRVDIEMPTWTSSFTGQRSLQERESRSLLPGPRPTGLFY